MKDLRGTTAIVTGASRGIGVYIAKALAEEGVNLSLTARTADELEKVRIDIESMGVTAIATVGDVSSREDRTRLIERTEAELGPVDILVNNAGIDIVRHFHEAPEADFVDTLRINLEAPMLLTRAIVPGMLERDRGHVVNISSGAGKVGVPGEAAYCASKHGLVGFTNALRAGVRADERQLLGRLSRTGQRCRNGPPLGAGRREGTADRRKFQARAGGGRHG